MKDSQITINYPKTLTLYIHIPFCYIKCPYCDFNTYSQIENLFNSYTIALKKEIELWSKPLANSQIQSVFFGGGTPSYLPIKSIKSLMHSIFSSFNLNNDAEITFECNPDDLTARKLNALLENNVNRLSIGIQSFNNKLLKILGRNHSATKAQNAIKRSLMSGFTNVNIDLMYGLPTQTINDWIETLDISLNTNPQHISMYCLTLEKGTPMNEWVKSKKLVNPNPDVAAEMYSLAQQKVKLNQFEQYEISNWSKPQNKSTHNINYWRNGYYIGIGPGAHSHLPQKRFWNINSPKKYTNLLTNTQINVTNNFLPPVIEKSEHISKELEMAETMILGLRLLEGINVCDFNNRFNINPLTKYNSTISDLVNLNLIYMKNNHIRLTNQGFLLGNEVFSRILENVNQDN